MTSADDYDFHSVFRADYEAGKLFWIAPPKNHAEKLGREAGSLTKGKGKNKSYWYVRVFSKTFKRSRVMFFMAYGRWPTPVLDHKDGNSINDRLTNLRECTYSENTMSSADKKRAVSLPRGVYLTRQGKYIARIQKNGQMRNLGTSETPEVAHSIYLAARKELFGEFA